MNAVKQSIKRHFNFLTWIINRNWSALSSDKALSYLSVYSICNQPYMLAVIRLNIHYHCYIITVFTWGRRAEWHLTVHRSPSFSHSHGRNTATAHEGATHPKTMCVRVYEIKKVSGNLPRYRDRCEKRFRQLSQSALFTEVLHRGGYIFRRNRAL